MERIKINCTTPFIFSITIPVRITDINYGNHVGNDTFLSFLHEARVQFLAGHGYTELCIEGIGLIMADVAMEYKSELVYGDIATVAIALGPFTKLGFDIFYKITVVRNGQEVLAAKAKTGMMGFDYQAKKKTSIPEAAIERLSGKF